MTGYWDERKAALDAQMERDEARLKERLAARYDAELSRLEREIASYYARFGEDGVIEYRKLLSALDEADRALLIERMDEFARKHPRWAHLMPVRESIYRLDELEGLQASVYVQQAEIGAMDADDLKAHLEAQAVRYANLAAERLGFGSSFYAVDSAVVAATVGAKWAQGKSFSERVWGDRSKLAAYLNDDFAKLVARGAKYDQCVKELGQRFGNVSRRDMFRLVYTEGTFVSNEAHAKVMERSFDRYALSCADSNACKVCREVQSAQKASPARFADRRPGANFPPLHPWCRCSYTVEVADWDEWIEDMSAKGGL